MLSSVRGLNSTHRLRIEVLTRDMMFLRTHNEYNKRKLKSLDPWSCFRALICTLPELSEDSCSKLCCHMGKWTSQAVHHHSAAKKTLCTSLRSKSGYTRPQTQKFSELAHSWPSNSNGLSQQQTGCPLGGLMG